MHIHKHVHIHYTPCTIHTCMFTKYLRKRHITFAGEKGGGVRGGRVPGVTEGSGGRREIKEREMQK